MRGVVLNAASRKRDYSYAILITAGMFSLMHGNPIQTVHQFLLGAVLAYVVLVSKSLWAGINDDTYGSLTPDKTRKILKELREAE